MKNHTPGPWQLDSEFYRFGAIIAPDFGQVAAVRGDLKLEALANARLIAAAPELLEALKGFVQRAEQLNGIDTGPLAQARAAIAKCDV